MSPAGLKALDGWLQSLLWEETLPEGALPHKFEIHRTKGLVPMLDGSLKLIQGVREVFEILDARDSPSSGQQKVSGNVEQGGKVVLIGRGVESELFGRSLRKVLDAQL